MSENNNNNTAENTETISQLARNLVAEHPWFMGLTTAAVTAALSHFYYGNKALTTAAWAFAALVGGVALSKIAAHAREIELAAKAAIAMPGEIIAVGTFLEGAIRAQAQMLRDLQAENDGLRAALTAEIAEAKAHRDWSVQQTAEAKVFAAKATEDFAKAVALAKQQAVIEVPAAPAVVVEVPAPVVAETPAPKAEKPVTPAKAAKAA